MKYEHLSKLYKKIIIKNKKKTSILQFLMVELHGFRT